MDSSSSFSAISSRVRGVIQAFDSRRRGEGWATLTDSPPGAISEREFNELALELFALQFEQNAPYRRYCEAQGAVPGNREYWTQIPAVPTSAFKEFELTCLVPALRTAVFHSSGTTEQRPSRHFHSHESLALYEASLLAWFEACVVGGRESCAVALAELNGWHLPLLVLTPPPAEVPHSSLVHMFETIRRQRGAPQSAFVGRVAPDGGWELDMEATLEFLAAANQPIMMFGTAFGFVRLLDYITEREMRFVLPPGSRALETGGYKGRSRTLPKSELHGLITHCLGIPAVNIVGEYGMSELSSQAYDLASSTIRLGPHASFRFAPWARVQIVSPETGRELREGETGLIRVYDLANVYSVMAIQTEDLGRRRGRGFELMGRAALAEPRGCSLMEACIR